MSLGRYQGAAVALDAATRDYAVWGAEAKVVELRHRLAALQGG